MIYPVEKISGTILVADDHGPNRVLLEEMLSAAGFTVSTASDGASALRMFESARPDLVLLDVMMPHPHGFEVCQPIRSNKGTCLTPVILVTALCNTEERVRGITAGADDFLTKPVDRSELLARVRSLLKLKAHTDELERAESVLFALARSIEGKDPTVRPYKRALSSVEALEIMAQEVRQGWWDINVFSEFEKLIAASERLPLQCFQTSAS
jgi:putative two-component system response regulator